MRLAGQPLLYDAFEVLPTALSELSHLAGRFLSGSFNRLLCGGKVWRTIAGSLDAGQGANTCTTERGVFGQKWRGPVQQLQF
jgi:hypothetical protein